MKKKRKTTIDLSHVTARRRLPEGRRYTVRIRPGRSLQYRKDKGQAASWHARVYLGTAANSSGYVTTFLGVADDAGGTMSYAEAWKQAEAWQPETVAPEEDHPAVVPLTVRGAVELYLAWFEQHRRSYATTSVALEAHVLASPLADRPLAALTVEELRGWHTALANAPARLRGRRGDPARKAKAADTDDPEHLRRRRSTANRVRAVLFAALNHAVAHWRPGYGPEPVPVWQRVKPFRGTAPEGARWLTRDEATRLLRVTEGDFRDLIYGALVTGARRGELAGLRCRDYNADTGKVTVPPMVAKTGKARLIPLTPEGVELFEARTAGRPRTARIFTNGGEPWGSHDHHRRLRAAYAEASITGADFYSLRHTYAARLKEAGVSSYVIADAMGNSPAMVEQVYGRVSEGHVAEQVRAHLPRFAAADDEAARKPSRVRRLQR